ncbi:origin recognition complex subunit 1 [Xylocopa sonorina]|uniref:origin recognition complex subunit 1 n=1 Tax=Xylocopa sonorina TaxID=1818115 RepID=UPI00403B340C
MASKLNKCTKDQIETILNTESDSNEEIYPNNAPAKSKKESNMKAKNATRYNLDMSSDTENIFTNERCTTLKHNTLQKQKAPLKIKLKKSAKECLYTIDTDSDPERPAPKPRNRLLRLRKKSNSEVESEDSYTDNKNKSMGTKVNNDENFREETPGSRGSRTRRPPLRLSSYYCDSLSPSNSPSLRTRKNINYNEDKLLISSIISNIKTEKKLAKQVENKPLDSPASKVNLKPKNSTVKNNKQDHISPAKDEEKDSNTNPKVVKAKKTSSKKSNKAENITTDKLDCTPKKQEITNKEDLIISTPKNSTSVKLTKQKRMISESTPKNIQFANSNDNGNDEECLTDMYKRIKISSAVKTTLRTYRPKKIIAERPQANFGANDNIESIEGEQSSIDKYKRIKISSDKKNILTPQKKNNIEKSIESHLEETHLSTPKSRSMKCSTLTPSFRKRNNNLMKPTTPLQEARSRLHVSAVPKSLPCREEEFNNIFTFLRGKLEDKTGGCIYISGVPGTGKTATVNEAIRCLQKLIVKGELDDFNYVAINGMKLTEPRQAYVQILKQLDGKTATWEQSYRILEKRFRSTSSKMTLLLVDELDLLCTKRQDVVYNLLDWPTKSTAQLVIITIANTMDLPERVLMGRVTSRLGLTRLTFQPYSYKQLQEIVMSRLKDFSGFRAEAVQLVARKVSAVSGDARRALDICRRAMEIAESRDADMISFQDVTEAVTEMIASAKVQAIKHCSQMEQIFLQAVSAEVTRTSIEEVYFKDAYKHIESLCSFEGIKIPTVTETLAVCGRLGANRLLICEHSRNDIYQKILLNVSTDDIHYATQELDLN